MKLSLPGLSFGLFCMYTLPAIFVGMHLDGVAAKLSAMTVGKDVKKAYAASLPHVHEMTVEQHLGYLKAQYGQCSAGQNYLDIIGQQHQAMPLDSALEVSVMMQTLCETPLAPKQQ